jgi:MFS family permease
MGCQRIFDGHVSPGSLSYSQHVPSLHEDGVNILPVRTSLQPLYGQLANVFGRRWPTIAATTTFVLGSGICGGASNMTMLIAGRVIQGAGAGGIGVLIEMIVCDLVPLRERGKYLAIILGLVALGTALGPFFGGLIVNFSTWRWVFWLNLPVGSVALVLLVAFLKVTRNKDVNLATKLTSIDWAGNIIFITAICSVLLALSWAGAVYPWSSYHVIVPLVVGLLSLAGFLAFEGSRFAPQPTMPLQLMSNRTSATAFMLTLMHSIVMIWTVYFLPCLFPRCSRVIARILRSPTSAHHSDPDPLCCNGRGGNVQIRPLSTHT